MSRRRYVEVFYAFNGPGPYQCMFCEKQILAWWDVDWDGSFDERNANALVVHHLDENHFNNHPENLAPIHYGCHTALHRRSAPLVAKGSHLPEIWKQRISSGIERRMNSMSDEERARWLHAVKNGMQQVDKTPTFCTLCEQGPFKGKHGASIHFKHKHKENAT